MFSTQMENYKSRINSAAAGGTTVMRTEHAKVKGGRLSPSSPHFLFGLLLSVYFYGCALPLGSEGECHSQSPFISYSPAEDSSGKLRLAVKDIIDVQGEVTTAGSQYLAKTSLPAAHDAKCLSAARRSDVQIVGKTPYLTGVRAGRCWYERVLRHTS